MNKINMTSFIRLLFRKASFLEDSGLTTYYQRNWDIVFLVTPRILEKTQIRMQRGREVRALGLRAAAPGSNPVVTSG